MDVPPPRRRTGLALLLVLTLALGAGLAAWVVRTWYPRVETRVALAPVPIAAPLPGHPAPSGDPATLAAREDALAAQLAILEARTAATTAAADLAGGNATRAEGLMVAFAVRRAIDRGLGLGYLEQQLRDRFGASQPQAVALIVQAGREPVTVEDLRASLDAIGAQVAFGPADDGWWGALLRQLGGLLVIRREGTPSPAPGERLDRVRRLLAQRQVQAAMAEAARLPGAAGAGRWMTAARRFVDAHRALDTIEAAALTRSPAPLLPDAGQPAPGP